MTADEIVRTLMQLTSDVERFDSLVVLQRKLLQDRATQSDPVDDDQLSKHSERLSIEAAEIVASARQALHQLRQLRELSVSRSD
jgi:hypothetical protein